jgi:REP element-mobilizing transposase RayT
VQKGCEIVEGHLMSDHVHILISIPPKYSVAYSLKLRLVVLTTLVRS